MITRAQDIKLGEVMGKKIVQPKNLRKSFRLPEYSSIVRKWLNKLLYATSEYNDSVKKGLPFFSQQEIEKLNQKYRDGISWKEIDTELSKKGVIFKKPTFRKYLQEKKIPPAQGYKTSKKGREAIYPPEIIDNINFVQYFYRMADNELIKKLSDGLSGLVTNAKDVIVRKLDSSGLYNLDETIFYEGKGITFGSNNIQEIVHTVLRHDPEFGKKALAGLEELLQLAQLFDEKYRQWATMLENCEIPILKIS